MRRTWFAIVAAVALSADMWAQSGSATQASSSEWTGVYSIARGRDLEGLTPVAMGPSWHALILAHLQPWARLRMEATDGVAEDTGAICKPDGIFRYPTNAGTFLWLPARDRVLIVWEEIATAGIQRVYLNRTHPKNLRPTWGGHSIGRWEGETLVVDTIGFNDKSWLSPFMEPHTEEAHLIQRIRRVRDGKFIEIVNTLEDRHALTSAITYSRYYKRIGESLEEDVCHQDPHIWREFRMQHLKPLLDRSREVR